MTIRPTTPGSSERVERTRSAPAEKSKRGSERSAAAGRGPARTDDVRISGPARGILTRSGESAVPQGELAPERLRGITQRIEQGHYGRPEVIDEVLRRLAQDL